MAQVNVSNSTGASTVTANSTTDNTSAEGYLTDSQINSIINGNSINENSTISNIMSTKTNGIEGLPYQFLDTVDRRINTDSGTTEVGRKYGDKIFSRLPLVFLTPAEPVFMDDFNNAEKEAATSSLLSGRDLTDIANVFTNSGKYYSVEYAYDDYYEYLNVMLACISIYLGIHNEQIAVGNQSATSLYTIDWSNELNDDFKTFFDAAENLVFYADSMDQIQETLSNDTTESSLASTINGFSDQAREIRFLFGSSGSAAAELVNSASEVTSNITSTLSGVASNLGGGIIGSLADKGVNSILNGGKIIFPEVWSNSDYSKSYSLEFKLRSPDHDSLSIFLNILKPYCKLLALTMPRQLAKDDANSYTSPFLVKAYSKGMFNIDMGIISSMSVSKGATCQWNDDGLPTQIDISIEIKDMYHNLMMSKFELGTGLAGSIQSIVYNTSYMDFLANTAGLNIAQMEMGRRLSMAYYLVKLGTNFGYNKSSIFRKFNQGVSKIAAKLYNIL